MLVVTTVHHPLDARIAGRQIASLLAHGHRVTYAASFAGHGARPPDGVDPIDIRRSAGRRRVGAMWDAARTLRRHAPDHDVVVLHDPELVPLARLSPAPVVWDVHEDLAAQLVQKEWLPSWARTTVGRFARWLYARGERTCHILLAERSYDELFERRHPFIGNDAWYPDSVPPPGDDRVVYVGRVNRVRGADTLLALPTLLPPGVALHVIGGADADDVAARFVAADQAGALVWHGPLANDQALELVRGALAGVSPLRDLPNFAHSMPTKIVEYLAQGVPAVTTPLPLATELVERHGGGVVVPFDDPAAMASAISTLHGDRELRDDMARRGRRTAADHDWSVTGRRFVDVLEYLARQPHGPADEHGDD